MQIAKSGFEWKSLIIFSFHFPVSGTRLAANEFFKAHFIIQPPRKRDEELTVEEVSKVCGYLARICNM